MTGIEKVARACCHRWKEAQVWKQVQSKPVGDLCGIRGQSGRDRCGCGYQDTFMAQARAAIEASREPNELMLAATIEDGCCAMQKPRECWQAMIDALLNEKAP